MEIFDGALAGLKIIRLQSYVDNRGFFIERFNQNKLSILGLKEHFCQDNHSRSFPGVIRGLHYQYDKPQGKLVGCIRGSIWDVAVDLRKDSSSFGKHFAIELSDNNGLLLWIPAGFAHGFYVLGDQEADVIYKVNELYNPKGEGSIFWNDSDLGIQWPIKNPPLLSQKDAEASSFMSYCTSDLSKNTWWETHLS